ncbi:MAG: type II 3-dehydroquinate dehydratase [Myxococcales bacterium]|nr:type II 3-dehydroquinate dehydratase [Myxococcales bacterium]
MQILLLNGPNLDLLGEREPDLYGRERLVDIERKLTEHAAARGVELRCAQSNHEGVLIEHLHAARRDCDGIILNPAGYGHTSVALRDALISCERPVVEVHLTNLARREAFRQHTLTADVAIGQISGFGPFGYQLALDALVFHLSAAGERHVRRP